MNVTNSALESGNWTGMLKMTLITSACQLLPILFIYARVKNVYVLPDSVNAAKAQCCDDRRTVAGAYLFYGVFFASIVYSLVQSFYVAARPGYYSVCIDR